MENRIIEDRGLEVRGLEVRKLEVRRLNSRLVALASNIYHLITRRVSLASSLYLLLLCCFVCPTSVLHAQTLNDYLQEASENNPALKASYKEFEASLQRVSQVNALPDPTLSFGYFISPIETRLGPQRARFSLSQMFPWFGTLKAQKDVASLMAEAKYQEFINVRNEQFLKVKLAYYPLYELKQKLRLQKENLSILETYKTLATTSFSNGKGSLTNVIRVDIMIDNTKTEIQLLEDQLIPLEVTFNRLLNRPDSLPVIIDDSLSIEPVEQGYRKDSLASANPMLQALTLKMDAAEASAFAAKKQGMPKFGVGLDYVIVGQNKSMDIPNNGKDAFMPMVTMSLPVFRGKYKASIKEAALQQEAFTLKKEGLMNELIASYEMSWYELEKAQQEQGLYDRQIKKTQQVIELLYTAYSNSGKDFEEILRQQQELIKYKTAKATAVKNYYYALAKLDYITATK